MKKISCADTVDNGSVRSSSLTRADRIYIIVYYYNMIISDMNAKTNRCILITVLAKSDIIIFNFYLMTLFDLK